MSLRPMIGVDRYQVLFVDQFSPLGVNRFYDVVLDHWSPIDVDRCRLVGVDRYMMCTVDRYCQRKRFQLGSIALVLLYRHHVDWCSLLAFLMSGVHLGLTWTGIDRCLAADVDRWSPGYVDRCRLVGVDRWRAFLHSTSWKDVDVVWRSLSGSEFLMFLRIVQCSCSPQLSL